MATNVNAEDSKMLARIDERTKLMQVQIVRIEARTEENSRWRVKVTAWAAGAAAASGVIMPWLGKFLLALFNPPVAP